MKILVVSASILPYSGGSSVIIENLARNFAKEEMIVVGAKGLGFSDDFERYQTMPEFKYFFSELSFFGRGARFFNWFRRFRIASLKHYLTQLIAKEKITHIIGVYPNQYYCYAAMKAAKQMNIPFSSYFHNTFIENAAISDKNAVQQQNEIFESSDTIFVMSDGMKTFYERKYGLDKFQSLVHTFDAYPERALPQTSQGSQEKTKLVAIGNFNESNLEASRRLINALKSDERYSLSVYTHVPKLLLKNRGIDTDFILYKGAVHPDEIHSVLQEYDICILTHGFKGGYGEIEYQTIFPTRTIPFLLSGKPMLVHAPEQSFLSTFIKKNNCGLLVDEPDEAKIIAGLNELTSNMEKSKQLVANAKATAEQFYGPNVKTFLMNQLKKN